MKATVQKFSGYKQAIIVALITFLVGACFGTLSLLMPITMAKLGCTYSEVGLPSTVETITCFIAGLFAGKFMIKFQAKRCVLACSIVSAAFVAVYAYAPSLLVICIYEAFLGVFMACGYSTGMNAFLSKWFIEKREAISGYAQAFIGFGAALGSLIFGEVYASYGLMAVTVIFAFTGVIAAALYLFFMRNPEEIGEKALGWENAEKLAKAEGSSSGTDYGVGFNGAVKSLSFYLVLTSCLLWALSMILFPYFATVLQSGGVADVVSARFQSLGQICLAIFCIIIGTITSKFGAKTYILCAFGSCLIGAAALGVWCYTGISVLIYVAALFLGSGYAVGTTYGPMITTSLFGTKEYERIIPIVFGMRCIGLGAGIWIVPAIAEKTQNWANGCWAALIMLTVGAVLGYLAVLFSPMKKIHDNSAD